MCVVPGKDRLPVAVGKTHQGSLELEQGRIEPIDRAPGPEPQVRGHLVVPRATGVESTGDGPDALRERRLDVEVDVLERGVPGEATRLDVFGEAVEPGDELVDLGSAQQADAPETADVGDRSDEVVGRELPVDVDRGRERLEPLVARLAEPPAPEPHRPSVVWWTMLAARRPRGRRHGRVRPGSGRPPRLGAARRLPPGSGRAASRRAARIPP